MKRVLSVVAVALFVLGVGYKIWNDPEVQKLLPQANATVARATNTAPPRNTADPVASTWANALCRKDAQTLFDNSSGAIAYPLEQVQTILGNISWTCTSVRYLGVVNTVAGPESFFAFEVGQYELWYGVTVVDGKAVDIE